MIQSKLLTLSTICCFPPYSCIQQLQQLSRNRIHSHVIIQTMKIISILALLFIALSSGITFTELQEKMLETVNSPFVHLIFVYDSASQMGPLLEKAINEIGTKKEGYFKILPVDCNTEDKQVAINFPYCSQKIRPKLPALMYSEPSLNPIALDNGEAPEPRNHQYQGQLQQKALYEFAIPLMKLYSTQLKKPSDWAKFKESYPQTPKVIYFTDKDKISPFYKSLTAHFRHTIAFAHVFRNSSLCEQFGVNTFPTLLLDGKERIEMTSNLKEQVQMLKPYEGLQTKIVIQQYEDLANDLSADQIEQKVLKNPQHILVHIAAADGSPHPEWKKTQESFKRMFTYFQAPDLAKELGVKHRPAIIYYPKSLTKKELKKTIFYSNNNFRSIYDEISSLIEDFTVPLSSDIEMQQMTSLSLQEGRFVVVLFHKEEISLSYRVLSNDQRFKEDLVFFRMKDPDRQVLSKFHLKKLPTLLIMTVDKENTTKSQKEQEEGKKGMNLQIAEYKGKFNYDDLQKFLNVFVEKPKEQEVQSTKEVKEIKTKSQLQSRCFVDGCYLLLVDGNQQKKASNAQYINVLKRSASKVYHNVDVIDAKCHSQFLSGLQIYSEDLPTFIFLNSKFKKYSRLVGRIEQKSIENLVQRLKANKATYRAYDNLFFQNKNCQKEHQRLKELENPTYTLSDQQAQILEEIRLEQQRKKQEASAAAEAGGESKKKRRKRRPKEEDSDL